MQQGRLSIHHPLLSLLTSVTSIRKIKQLHAHFLTSGLFLHPFPPSKLLHQLIILSSSSSSSSSSLLSYADAVFFNSPSPPLFSYNTLIRAHSSPFSFQLFRSLLRRSPEPPNQYTLTFLLSSDGLSLNEADQVRVQVLRRGFEGNVFVSNAMVKVYGSLGSVEVARKVFDGMLDRDLYSWNSMIGGYVSVRDMESARELFRVMPDRDVVSWTSLLAGFVQV